MDFLLKAAAILMVLLLFFSQIVLASPIGNRLVSDEYNGVPLMPYQTTIRAGTITLDVLGDYTPNSATLLVNGIRKKAIDSFPIELNVVHGDVVEFLTARETKAFYVFIVARSAGVHTDLSDSSVMIKPGIKRLFTVLIDQKSGSSDR